MNEEYYISLIYKELDSVITPAEKEELEQWASLRPENQQLVDEVVQAWELSGSYAVDAPIDLEVEYGMLRKKMDVEQGPAKPAIAKRRFLRPFIAAAAIALLLMAGGWFYFQKQSDLLFMVGQQDRTLVTLSDGTQIWLRKGAHIRYPTVFDGEKRSVELQGEAFFEVAHQANQPFEVTTSLGKVTVLGTSFNLRTTAKQSIDLDVVTGKVKLELVNSDQEAILTAGQGAEGTLQSGKIVSKPQANENATAWYTGQLQFVDVPLSEVFRDLEHYYQLEISSDGAIVDCPFTYTFERATLETIESTLSRVFELKLVKISPAKYRIEGGSCD